MKRLHLAEWSLPCLLGMAAPLSGCPGDGGGGGDAPPTYGSAYRVTDCMFTAPESVRVECGTLTVPESYDAPDGKQIELAVSRFRSRSKRPQPDPLVYLSGGPGGAGIAEVLDLFATFEPTLEARDVIAIDQRGTGQSKPSLNCEVGDDEEDIAVLRTCHAALEKQGVDVAQYNTLNNAKDLRALREALGIERWNALGTSYGTRVVLEMLREDGDAMRAAVLDSVVPPDVDNLAEKARSVEESFAYLFTSCEADAVCGQYFPDLKARFFALVERLDASPMRVNVGDEELEFTGGMLIDLMGGLLYDTFAGDALPLLVFSLERDDPEFLETLLEADGAADSDVAVGMFLSVVCAEWLPMTSEESYAAAIEGVRPEIVASFDSSFFEEACAVWDVPAASERAFEPVESDVPTLILAGALDPATPPHWGERVQKTLENAHFSLFGGASHGVLTTECGAAFIADFLAAPDEVKDPSCPARTGPLAFELLHEELGSEKTARSEPRARSAAHAEPQPASSTRLRPPLLAR